MIPINQLAIEIGQFEAIEIAYPEQLTETAEGIQHGLPVLVECDKGLVAYFYRGIRDRLRNAKIQCVYIDGRAEPAPGQMPMGIVPTMIQQIREAVRTATEARVLVLPHLDLLVTSQGGLTTEAKEATTMLYENPNILWIGFKDNSLALPEVISNLFPKKVTIFGVNRERLRYLITQKEARKLGQTFNPYQLYSYVSGVNAVRLRKILASLHGEDLPADTRTVYAQIRKMTCPANMEMPNVSLEGDIGGYPAVKNLIQSEILDLIRAKSNLDDVEQIKDIEKIIPRGIIFHGPPGTGKSFFAKAMATEMGATLTVVSGPELKSKWVGESEERIRQLFAQARESAPSIIVFDEIDSIAPQRGTYHGSGVEHSMVNQLLTELDGFRSNEMVFVVATTNFVESIDSALLRPGRLEFHIEIPYPDEEDRREILAAQGRSMKLNFSPDALSYAVKQTGKMTSRGTLHSGDDLKALCRGISRFRLRNGLTGLVQIPDVKGAMEAHTVITPLTSDEELVVATHEAGHALVALSMKHGPKIDKISIQTEFSGALGYVAHKKGGLIHTQESLKARLASLMGGRAAEIACFGLQGVSLGCGQDLAQATAIARDMVTKYGMGRQLVVFDEKAASADARHIADRDTEHLCSEAGLEAEKILTVNKAELVRLRDLLLKHKELSIEDLNAHGFHHVQ